jgi:hypothetical protein
VVVQVFEAEAHGLPGGDDGALAALGDRDHRLAVLRYKHPTSSVLVTAGMTDLKESRPREAIGPSSSCFTT